MVVEPWPLETGVVEFPNGARVRGRGLRHERPTGVPTVGVYLLRSQPPASQWTTEWIEWPDFRIPADPDAALRTLRTAFDMAATGRVEIGCRGGRGRTGTAMAALAIMSGIDPTDAVAWVRARYHPKAVETPGQRRWIASLTP